MALAWSAPEQVLLLVCSRGTAREGWAEYGILLRLSQTGRCGGGGKYRPQVRANVRGMPLLQDCGFVGMAYFASGRRNIV